MITLWQWLLVGFMNSMNPLNFRITEGLSKSTSLSVSIPIDQRIPSWNLFVLYFWPKDPASKTRSFSPIKAAGSFGFQDAILGCVETGCCAHETRNALRQAFSLVLRPLDPNPVGHLAFFGWGSPSVLPRNSGINIWKFTVCSSCHGFYSWCLFILFSGSSHDGAENFWKLEKNSHCCDFWHEEIHLTPSK